MKMIKNTGLSASSASSMARIGLGTANFGLDYGFVRNPALFSMISAEDEAFKILDQAIALGVRIFDTSHHYGPSESILARYLKTRNQKASVVSKFKIDSGLAEARESADRLGDSLKTLLWHDFNPEHPDFKSQLKSFEVLKKEMTSALGAGLQMGCSTYGAKAASLAASSGLFDCIEAEFNALNPSVARTPQVKWILRSLLQKGFLTDAVLSKIDALKLHDDEDANQAMRSAGSAFAVLAKKAGRSAQDLALGYALSVTQDEILLVGVSNANELVKNAECVRRGPLEPALVGEIDAIHARLKPEWLDLRKWKKL